MPCRTRSTNAPRFALAAQPRRSKDAKFCVLQYDNYVKERGGGRMVWQKVDYIHENPVRAGLAAKPEDYAYSSFRTYLRKGLSLVKVDPVD